MRIQLVNAPMLKTNRFSTFTPSMWPPLGIMYLASYLNKHLGEKVELKLTDGALIGQERALEAVVNFKPDILGVSATTVNSTGGYRLINKAKKQLPNVLAVYGGVHASALPEDVYRSSKTDLVVIGEGEKTLLEIVRIYQKGKNDFGIIPGLAIFKNGKIIKTIPRQFITSLDDLPFPAYEFLENRSDYAGWFFQKQSPETVFSSTRGCPYRCFFCTDAVWKSSRPYLRVRSPKNIADELEWLNKNYGIKEYFDMADEFNCIEAWAIDVCHEIRKRKLGLTWKCQLRADKVSDNFARSLAEAGCWYVHLGVESGNQRTLDGIGKRITLDQVRTACKNLKKYGIKVDLLLMLFNIWEEKSKLAYEGVAESLNTLKFARNLFRNDLADFLGWSATTPFPGTPLYRFLVKNNRISQKNLGHWEKWDCVWNIPVNLPGVSRFDYTRVKTIGSLLQSWYFFKKMRRGINRHSSGDLFRRSFVIIVLLSRLTKVWFLGLFEK